MGSVCMAAVSAPPRRRAIGAIHLSTPGAARIAPWPLAPARWSAARASARRSTGALAALRRRPGRVVGVEGEPGIGKSRLLAHLAERAAAAGCTVLERARVRVRGRPAVRAVDARRSTATWPALGERRLARLGLADPGALAAALPALARRAPAAPADRHRTHRALRDLLERLAAARPLVLCLDDVHWADPASVDALAALVRRPPAAPVLLALAAREGQLPAALAAALGGALREDRVAALALGAAERGRGGRARRRRGRGASTPPTGGNPFYLEQLARAAPRARGRARGGRRRRGAARGRGRAGRPSSPR